MVKRKAPPNHRQRTKPKKKCVRKMRGAIINLTGSDNEDGVAASTEHLTKVQAKASENTSIDVEMIDGGDVVNPAFDQQTEKQAHAEVSGNNKPEPSKEETQRLLWRLLVRKKEKEAAALKKRNEKNARDGKPLERAAPDDWTDSDEAEEEPWTFDEDEELARWKLGGFSDEQLDWPTFHQSRTWDDLMARLTWLETKHPKCWVALKKIEEQDRELFERELSVEIEQMKSKGLLPSSSDEMSYDGSEKGSVQDADEEPTESSGVGISRVLG